jgi:hypothetical protein
MKAMVQFGSQISGGANSYSDRDLLVICPSEKRKNYLAEYGGQGYSVSFYTPSQLKYMKIKGSLFLQHLKLESKVISDDNGDFKRFIDSCELIAPNMEELERCKSSIKNAILSPKNKLLHGWLSDYLYVLSRDYFVKYFAAIGKLLFNADRLCSSIENQFNLAPNSALPFLELRTQKNIYRNRVFQLKPNYAALDSWIKLLVNLLDLDVNQHWAENSEISYLNKYPKTTFNNTYELLRYTESLRLLFPEVTCSDDKEKLINKLITTPNNYCSTSVAGNKYLKSYLSEFVLKANKALQSDKICASLQFCR